jgi:type III secretion protein T
VAWIFWVLQSAGSLIDNQRGASIASSIDPLQGADSTPLGNLLSLAFTTYIFATASVLQVIGLLFASFKIWPVSKLMPALSSQFPTLILTVFDYSMRLGFNVAAPIVAVMFLAEFALAMVSRFSPQVQVFVLAMPIKSLLAIMMLIFYASVLLPYANHQLLSINGVTNQLYGIFRFGETLRHGSPQTPTDGSGP